MILMDWQLNAKLIDSLPRWQVCHEIGWHRVEIYMISCARTRPAMRRSCEIDEIWRPSWSASQADAVRKRINRLILSAVSPRFQMRNNRYCRRMINNTPDSFIMSRKWISWRREAKKHQYIFNHLDWWISSRRWIVRRDDFIGDIAQHSDDPDRISFHADERWLDKKDNDEPYVIFAWRQLNDDAATQGRRDKQPLNDCITLHLSKHYKEMALIWGPRESDSFAAMPA